MSHLMCYLTLFCVLLGGYQTYALSNGLGFTPQMGWNSWNHFGCDGYNYTTIKQTADALISTGLKDAGYIYLNLDDCWADYVRDSEGRLQPDPKKFPASSGQSLQSLIDYVHSKGLKFGLYSDAGRRTCARHDPGSYGHEQIDAETWASWGVDYLKYDNCYNEQLLALERYPQMRNALTSVNRTIYFSLCEWGREDVPTWGRAVGNSWRTTSDIKDNWDSMLSNLYNNNNAAAYGGPGGWNDPDMLEVGNGGMTTVQYTTHFSMWCLVKAPLIIGCDISNMSPDTSTILLNHELIAINQDARGVPGKLIKAYSATTELWAGPLEHGNVAVVLFNKGNDTATITFQWTEIDVLPYVSCMLRDLWAHKDLGYFDTRYSADVVANGVVVLRVIPAYCHNYVPPQLPLIE